MRKYDITIIGGGASGLMAAYSASKNKNKNILLLEKNEKFGKKIYITGKGRCNITNDCDVEDFFDNITRNPEFMYSSIYNFTNKDTIKFFENQSLKLKIERGKRVFPSSDKSSDVINCLINSLGKNVDKKLNEEVKNIEFLNNKYYIYTNKDKYETEKLILATGGLSYPGTGSTGDGYSFSKSLGHKIINLKPSLCPIVLNNYSEKQGVVGLTVKNSTISLFYKKKKLEEIFGDFLFTHKGISGPIILTLSDILTDLEDEFVELYCDFKPAIPFKELEERFLEDIDKNPKKNLKNILSNYFPQRLADYILLSATFNSDIKMYEINKEIRKEILNLMKNYKFDYLKVDHIRQAIITKGGVNTLEINPSTMESKIHKNLYFCGELIDVNALTGGYNLQIAFSTGYLAGMSASE